MARYDFTIKETQRRAKVLGKTYLVYRCMHLANCFIRRPQNDPLNQRGFELVATVYPDQHVEFAS